MERVLPQLPSLSKLYLNAAATSARHRLARSSPEMVLPERVVAVHGVVPDLDKVTAFAHLMGEPARDVVPSGYLHALAFPVAMAVMVDDDFPLPLLGMIHLRNEVHHHAPVLFNDAVNIRAWARGLAGHRRGTEVQLVSEIRAAADDRLLWLGVSSYLAKGVFLPGLDKPAPPRAERPPYTPPSPTAQWRLGVDTGRAYAAVSGDFNPIHLSVLSAKALGMRRSIAHGMYAASRIVGDVAVRAPDAFAWDITFDTPVFLPATVSLRIADQWMDDGAWAGATFEAWNARSLTPYFHGRLSPGLRGDLGHDQDPELGQGRAQERGQERG